MASFAVDPEPFVLPTMVIEDGDLLRRARREVYIRGRVPKTHEDCAIAVVNGISRLPHVISFFMRSPTSLLCSISSM
jgi:hypothetical protein